MAEDWRADIILVNESADETTPGDVSVFRSLGEACRWLEPWWVENHEGFAFTATGARLTLGMDSNNSVIVVRQEHVPHGPKIVLGWLCACATAVLDARRSKAERGKAVLSRSEEQGQLPLTTEGLIAYVGFQS
ncbi:hypothetical protein [Altericroceibacterium xinjiangense]|uniref:hypothetical protein n=1 Tax=Altericroceibacterium xinjiangense TaxID=762261 RepID=UPI000F7F9154|nr:hypothetical protein [Altericroceibacterium xinjiangense]